MLLVRQQGLIASSSRCRSECRRRIIGCFYSPGPAPEDAISSLGYFIAGFETNPADLVASPKLVFSDIDLIGDGFSTIVTEIDPSNCPSVSYFHAFAFGVVKRLELCLCFDACPHHINLETALQQLRHGFAFAGHVAHADRRAQMVPVPA